MSYKGIVADVPFGNGGLLTDDAPTDIPYTALIKATNVAVTGGVLTNEQGTCRYNLGSASNTVTFTQATSLVNLTAHNLINGQAVYFTTTGTLPTPLSASTTYYVVNASTNSFQVSSDYTTAITLSSAGSGTHTAVSTEPMPILNTAISYTVSSSTLTTSSVHNIKNGQLVYVSTTGVMPTPLVAGKSYIAINTTSTTLQLSNDGTNAITLSGSPSSNTIQSVDGIVSMYDWWPNTGQQFLVCVTRSGRVFRFKDRYTSVEITASGSAPTTLSIGERVHIMECGQETAGNPKLLFIFTGNNPIQVISGTNTTRTNISLPAADWSTNYPTFGLVYLNRVFAFGNSNFPHFVYASSNTNNQDFTAAFNTALFNVYPGDSQKIIHAFSYKGRLHIAKYPRGLYGLTIQDIRDPTTWYFSKLNEDIGTTSIHGGCPVFDDYWMTSTEGSISSLSAAFTLGSIDNANVLRELKVLDYIRQNTSPLGFGERQALWHPTKKKALFLFRSSVKGNSILSFSLGGKEPKLSFIDGIQSDNNKINCMTLIKGSNYVDNLVYGQEDGFIYYAEQENRWRDQKLTGSQYDWTMEAQTPHMDFAPKGQATQSVAMVDKNFDFIELQYIPTGAFNISADVYIDGIYSETKSFYLGKAPQLDSAALDTWRIQGDSVRTQRLPIHGRGRTISIRLYYTASNNGTTNKGFPVRLTSLRVFFRTSGESSKT